MNPDANILKDKTRSICPICYRGIEGKVIERDSRVYLLKECPAHGAFDCLVEKDPWVYKKLMNKTFSGKVPFANLEIPITHSCDLDCNVCFLHKKDNFVFSAKKIEEIISGFKGKFITLSGGEPLLRQDLAQIISYIDKKGKIPILATNGIELADIDYVAELKNAGLKWIHFSFNGFDDSVYEKINGEKLLKSKLRALNNIKKIKIFTIISVVLVRGVNENELRPVFRYCLGNNSFVKRLRVRTLVHMGKYIEAEPFCLSEIIEIFSKIIKVSKEDLVMHSLKMGSPDLRHDYNYSHMPCHIEIDVFSLFMDIMGINLDGNSFCKKLATVFKLWPRLGFKNIITMIARKIKKSKRLLSFYLDLRIWPDKYSIDFTEIHKCPAAYVSCDSQGNYKVLPRCYALILDDKDSIM